MCVCIVDYFHLLQMSLFNRQPNDIRSTTTATGNPYFRVVMTNYPNLLRETHTYQSPSNQVI